jgi:pyruvate formate lyase activating enzyme
MENKIDQHRGGLSRRDFLATTAKAAALAGVLSCPAWLREIFDEAAAAGGAGPPGAELAPLARYWVAANAAGVDCLTCHTPDEGVSGESHPHEQAVVRCQLCAQSCTISPGERGRCRARMNVDGQLRSLVYGHPATVHVDPIEKKPFYHFLPGSSAFSLATAGCPLHCRFCQNWELSQARPEDFGGEFTPPGAIVEATERDGVPVIAFTYNEPTVFTEYLTDIARAARKRGICSVLVSCGFMQEAPLAEMCDVLDAIKIDLKGFSEDFYRKVCSAELGPVLRSIKQVAGSGTHLEIVNLVVPTLNDSEYLLTELVKWVVGELGPDVPVHFTRFHPDYKLLNLPPTPVDTLERAYDIARTKGMHYPYVGNVPGHEGNNTYCPGCGRIVIRRTGFFVRENDVTDGRCPQCGERIAGVWQKPQWQ